MDTLWTEKYGPLYWRQFHEEQEARALAFLPVTTPVSEILGEQVRAMTLADLMLLEAARSPFIVGGKTTPTEITRFVWCIHVSRTGRFGLMQRLTRYRMIRRIARYRCDNPLQTAREQIDRYLDLMFIDLPSGGGADGKRAVFPAASYGVRLAEIAPADPYDGRPWCESPLPRVLQYMRAKAGAGSTWTAPSDRVMSDWLAARQSQQKQGGAS